MKTKAISHSLVFLHRKDVKVAVLSAAIALVVTLTYWGFRSPYAEYLQSLHLARNPGVFALDPIIANSVLLNAGIYYSLVKLLNFPIENDLIGLTLHFFLNGGVLFLLFRQARCTFGLADPTSRGLIRPCRPFFLFQVRHGRHGPAHRFSYPNTNRAVAVPFVGRVREGEDSPFPASPTVVSDLTGLDRVLESFALLPLES